MYIVKHYDQQWGNTVINERFESLDEAVALADRVGGVRTMYGLHSPQVYNLKGEIVYMRGRIDLDDILSHPERRRAYGYDTPENRARVEALRGVTFRDVSSGAIVDDVPDVALWLLATGEMQLVALAKLHGAWTLGSTSCVDHYRHRTCLLCKEGYARIEAPSSVTVSEAHA